MRGALVLFLFSLFCSLAFSRLSLRGGHGNGEEDHFSHAGGSLLMFGREGPFTVDGHSRRNPIHFKKSREVKEKPIPDPEFYSQFRCPAGTWYHKYGWTDEVMKEKARILSRFQRALEACEGFGRPGIRRYVKRQWVYEDPEWVKPLCRDYAPDARNVDHQCVKKNVVRNGEFNITKHDGCGKRFKCWPQMMVTHQGQMIFRPSYKAGSQSMRDMMKCYFPDFRREVWPCDNIYPNSRYTLSEDEQTYAVVHMVRNPVKRFASALIEQYTRWYKPAEKERYRLGLTKWFPLSEKNVSSQKLLNAFLRDTECNIDHPWWPHSATGMWHMTEYEYPDTLYDGTGKVSDIDYIFKIERFDNDWKTALEELEIPHKKRCRLTNINRHDDRDHIGPPKEEIMALIKKDRRTLRRICAIYFADFICFDYELPDVCADLVHAEPGVCPL